MLGKHITHCEDSLTAAVFTHLLHLPFEIFWKLLRSAASGSDLPIHVGEPSQVDFWPKWDATGTRNSSYVEPDVFIRFDHFDLIIEAKRWDHGMQDEGQWKREHKAYSNVYGEDEKPVRMLAVGGIWKDSDDLIDECPVHMCRWERLLLQCRRFLSELERSEYSGSQSCANKRILEHVIDLFAWHGFSTGIWFGDLNFQSNHLSSSLESHFGFLRARSNELSKI